MELVAQFHNAEELHAVTSLLTQNKIPHNVVAIEDELGGWQIFVNPSHYEDAMVVFDVLDEQQEKKPVTCPSCDSPDMQYVEDEIVESALSGTHYVYQCGECGKKAAL